MLYLFVGCLRATDVKQVRFHEGEQLIKALVILLRGSVERFLARLVAYAAHGIDQWPGLLAHVKEPAPPIARMLPALHQTALAKLVENANQGDRFDLQHLRQSGLMDTFIVREIGKRLPLRSRQSQILRALLEPLPKKPRNVMEEKAEGG